MPALGVSPACILTEAVAWTYNVDIDGRIPGGLAKHAWLITRTVRGYHVFLDIWEPSPHRALKRAWRIAKNGDRAHLIHARKRIKAGELLDFAVVRLAGKYPNEDIEVVHYREPAEVDPRYVAGVLRILKNRYIEAGRG
ncbi:MAG: hypothetical protein ACP5MH_11105 [Thermoproteus sp.]